MKKNQEYLEDLKEIKDIMNRSSRFISLSGVSGILAGIFAITGAWLAYKTVYTDQNYLGYRHAILSMDTLLALFGIAASVIVLSIGCGIFFTTRKARKNNQKIWDVQSKRLMVNLAIPLVTGGILCVILIFKGFIGIVAPLTLIFYGLGLVNASKYTLKEIRSLGLVEIILGLVATYFVGYGLIFWAVGFGIMHIIYGVVMHVKYGS